MQYSIKSVTMDDIARHMSISKKTIYKYFKDKHALVDAVTETMLSRDKVEMDRIQSQSTNAIEEVAKISAFLRVHLNEINPSLLYDLEKYHSNAWNIYIRYKHEVFIQSVIDNIQRGVEEGYFRSDVNPRMLGILRMEEIQMAMDNKLYPRDRFDYGQVQIHLFEHFVYGLLTKKGRLLLEELQNQNKTNESTTDRHFL